MPRQRFFVRHPAIGFSTALVVTVLATAAALAASHAPTWFVVVAPAAVAAIGGHIVYRAITTPDDLGPVVDFLASLFGSKQDEDRPPPPT
jgi:hypothetical protein